MPVSVPGAPSFPGVAHTSGCTTVITVDVLFALTGSVAVVAATAVFVSVVAVAGVIPVNVIVIGVASG